ncbi:MAG: hypothetical protein CMO55_25940 [Verrucomicrobiales bacterium]|nr:hypothetical protein [Verrucomicrobiales bacterium]
MSRPIEIIGGGLAGLTLGIALRRFNIPVRIRDVGTYPRHRVCGEFLSGSGVEHLSNLGVLSQIKEKGANWANDYAFFSETSRLHHDQLDTPTLCLSRYALDDLLQKQFIELGGTLEQNCRVSVTKESNVPGTVLATGRKRKATSGKWRWFGLKAHIEGFEMESDLEMHLHPDMYVGANQIENGRVNLCGLFRSPVDSNGEKKRTPEPEELLRGMKESLLYDRTKNATFLPDSLCAVAGLDLTPATSADTDQFRIGDSLTMIPPFTGNGMSMAIESAVIASEPLRRFSCDEISWEDALTEARTNLETRFSSRLSWATHIQSLLFSPTVRPALLTLGKSCGLIWKIGFAKTR